MKFKENKFSQETKYMFINVLLLKMGEVLKFNYNFYNILNNQLYQKAHLISLAQTEGEVQNIKKICSKTGRYSTTDEARTNILKHVDEAVCQIVKWMRSPKSKGGGGMTILGALWDYLTPDRSLISSGVIYLWPEQWGTDACRTLAVDDKHIYINPEFLFYLGLDNTGPRKDKKADANLFASMIIHELMHILLGHVARMEGKDPIIFNSAADYFVNYIIDKSKILLPKPEDAGETIMKIPGIFLNDSELVEKTQTVEECYAYLLQKQKGQQTQEQGLPQLGKEEGKEPKDGTPKDGTPKDGPPEDGTPKNGTPKNGIPKDGPPEDDTPKDGTPKNDTPKDGTPKNGTPKDGTPKNALPKDGPPEDGTPKDDTPENGTPKDGPPEDGTPKNALPKDGPPEDGPPEDGTPKDGTLLTPADFKKLYDEAPRYGVIEKATGNPQELTDAIKDILARHRLRNPNTPLIAGLGAGATGVFEAALSEKVDWQDIFQDNLDEILKQGVDQNYNKPNIFYHNVGIYPSRKGYQKKNIFVFVDTSGSCVDQAPTFVGEIVNALNTDRQNVTPMVYLFSFDTEVTYIGSYDQDSLEELKSKAKMPLGGGTDLRAPFKALEDISKFDIEEPPSVVIVFTDLEDKFPFNANQPDKGIDFGGLPYEVIWVVPPSYAYDTKTLIEQNNCGKVIVMNN